MSAFRITRQKGFHMEFENGWTVSVQWGPGNYCDHHKTWSEEVDLSKQKEWPSTTAEVAVFDPTGAMTMFSNFETVQGWQTPDQVAALIAETAARPREVPA